MSIDIQALRAAINNGAVHRLQGVITLANGTEIQLTEANMNKPTFTRQCTSTADSFMFGQLYSSTLSLKVLGMETLRRDSLRGGTVYLEFGAEGVEGWLPLGIWNITEPQRSSADSFTIKAVDNTSKLDVPIEDRTVGFIKLSTRLKTVKELTGLSFEGDNGDDVSGTVAHILELVGDNYYENMMFGTKFCATCRDEVNAIAQFIGGFAYINREGRIAFRKFGGNTAVTIPANRRFNISISEYSVKVAAIGYKYGLHDIRTPAIPGGAANTYLCLYFSENPYMWSEDEDNMREINRILLNITGSGVWIPGQLDFYGDPTIDLGDIVYLTGGVNGSTTATFLVTGYTWQFRGPMTLISAGAAEQVNLGGSSGGASGGGGSSGGGSGQSVIQKPWTMVELESYPQALTQKWREVAAALFAVAEQTLVIAHLTVNLTGSNIGEVVVHVLLDGVMQTEYSWDTIAGNQRLTTELNVPLVVSDGIHRLSIEAKGAATVDRIVASVYGQGVSEYTGEPTVSGDYRYHDDTIDEYIGSTATPRIPAQLGGNDIHILGGGSFAESAVEYTYIPDGVEEIK